MSEKEKVTLEELQKRVKEAKEVAEKSRDQIKEIVERRPLESTAMIFFLGFVLGVIVGAASSKHS
ncbi:hypothetical protein [[Eubacterium] cellulosolvens]